MGGRKEKGEKMCVSDEERGGGGAGGGAGGGPSPRPPFPLTTSSSSGFSLEVVACALRVQKRPNWHYHMCDCARENHFPYFSFLPGKKTFKKLLFLPPQNPIRFLFLPPSPLPPSSSS